MAAILGDSRARVRIGYPIWLRPFLARNVAAITLGRTIFIAKSFASRPQDELDRLLRHELAHVRQVERLGLLRFLWRYAGEYVRLRLARVPPGEAYRRISFEVEARAAEEEG
ncbi:MAG TPA: DUF4157 domain-containing protein [Thermoanaerobaculia bacterium]|nr:DUF4157 domain-containing protein [Thermoanaerobaculia bacterium]